MPSCSSILAVHHPYLVKRISVQNVTATSFSKTLKYDYDAHSSPIHIVAIALSELVLFSIDRPFNNSRP